LLMFRQLIPNEEQFIKKIVTDKYSQKYDQFKRRIQKLRAKELERNGIHEDENPEQEPINETVTENNKAVDETPTMPTVVKRKPWILP
jgi:hypothetical protein